MNANAFRTPQAPLPSGFGPSTTATEALAGRDLHGLTAIVTGGYSGLGLETARVLAAAGARVIVPARSPAKASAALADLVASQGVEIATVDLLDPKSIDRFSDEVLARGQPLHILINSAGIMAAPLARDTRGYESQFAANHLGHFQLAQRLWPALQKAGEAGAASARVVAVSSRGHRIAGVDFEDPHFMRRPYDRWQGYGQSKTANALFAVALDARGAAHNVRAFSVHPGSLTDLARHLSQEELQAMGVKPGSPQGHVPEGLAAAEGGDFKTIPQGAATSVWCAASLQLEGRGGVYCEDVDVAPEVGADAPRGARGVREWATNPDLAEQLWEMSERMIGRSF